MFNWRDVLPPDVYNSTQISCTNAQNNTWTLDGFYGPARLKIVVEKCRHSFCTMVTRSSGNPDISGIGMVTAYYFELAFVTMCYLAYASPYLYNLFKYGFFHPSQAEKPVRSRRRRRTAILASALRIHSYDKENHGYVSRRGSILCTFNLHRSSHIY
ncbi:hypothetical protein BDD12DRAFT_182034 [Trichophaea hybrida]|nr:hypothetical protein BDD12DRAFT_182034 [Trichophaea hybrida]